MPNQNPISTDKDGEFIDYDILQTNLEDQISISIEISLLDEGWIYDSDHIISLQGNPNDVYNDGTPPDQLPIGLGKDLIDKKFRTYSHIRRFLDGASNEIPSRVKYTITFFAGGQQLDQFEKTSGRTNPVDFITNIKFV